MNLMYRLKKMFWKMGFDVSRLQSHPIGRRRKLIDSYNIDIVLDVGANTGQFAKQMREVLGFSGNIISFEPLSEAYQLLEANAKKDPKWETRKFALGESNRKEEINIANNSYSSSFLNLLPQHLQSAPESEYVGKEIVNIKTLDSIFSDLCSKEDNVYLKIDTQGFESKVLEGAKKSIEHIKTIQLEMSLIPLYQHELLFYELYQILREKGFSLVSMEPGFCDKKSGELLQVDGIFHLK